MFSSPSTLIILFSLDLIKKNNYWPFVNKWTRNYSYKFFSIIYRTRVVWILETYESDFLYVAIIKRVVLKWQSHKSENDWHTVLAKQNIFPERYHYNCSPPHPWGGEVKSALVIWGFAVEIILVIYCVYWQIDRFLT